VIEGDDVAVGRLDDFPAQVEAGTRAQEAPGELEMGVAEPAGRAIAVGIQLRRY
jgi:hypothetical protein